MKLKVSMRRLMVICVGVLLLLLSACGNGLHIDQESSIINREVVEQSSWADERLAYYGRIYGWTADKYIIDIFTNSITTSYYNYQVIDIKEASEAMGLNHQGDFECIASLDQFAKIHHTQKISYDTLYTVHVLTDEFVGFYDDEAQFDSISVYTFFKYDVEKGCWKKTGDIYEVTSSYTEKSQYDDLKVGDSLSDVIAIDKSQLVAFHYKRMVQDEFESHHITKDGLLTIKYDHNGELSYETQADDLTVKSMEWSPLPILEKDLPK